MSETATSAASRVRSKESVASAMATRRLCDALESDGRAPLVRALTGVRFQVHAQPCPRCGPPEQPGGVRSPATLRGVDSGAHVGTGGGAGGNGGALTIISHTKQASAGTLSIAGGAAGTRTTGGNTGAGVGDAGGDGNLTYIEV